MKKPSRSQTWKVLLLLRLGHIRSQQQEHKDESVEPDKQRCGVHVSPPLLT